MSARLVSDAAFVAALGAAQRVRLSAYVLQAGSPVVRALERASDGGAAVDVVLDGVPYGKSARLARVNAVTAAELERHGVRVRATGPGEPALHSKAAVLDGTAYLDDRNWATGDRDSILALDDPEEVAVVAAAFAGTPAAAGSLATGKTAALALEAETIYEAAGDRIDVETESFAATAISTALAYRAARGSRVRLLVAEAELRGKSGLRERRALAKLAATGVEIAATANTEKLCVANDTAWVGSANATFSPGPMLDWGFRANDPAIVAGLGRAFERNWNGARALSPV